MLTSTPTKEKKKTSSPSKHIRLSSSATLKRNPNYDLKKDELIQLLTRFEGELQAKEIALATLKAEKMKSFLSIGRLSSQTDPIGALLRDGQYIKDEHLNEEILLKTSTENSPNQIDEFLLQQRKQIEILEKSLEQSEKRCLSLSQQLENERQEKKRFQSFQNLCLRLQEEKFQLRNELNDVKLHNEELEQQLIQLMKFVEFEHERHKKFVVLFLNERKLDKARNEEKPSDDQNETRLKQLEIENERNKEILTGKIQQLQNEIDRLVNEKKNEENSNSNSSIRRPTIIPTATSKLNGKTNVIPQTSSIPNRTQPTPMTNSIVELPISPVSSNVKRQLVPPTRSITNLPQSPVSSSSNIPRNAPTGGIPRLTKTTNTIVKPTSTTAPTKRPGQTSFSSEHKVDHLRTLFDTIQTVVENRLKSSADRSDSPSSFDHEEQFKTDSSTSDSILFRAAQNNDKDQLEKFLQLGANANCQLNDGNTALHFATEFGHVESIRILLNYGANPFVENRLGLSSWNSMTKLDQPNQLKCFELFLEFHFQPPIDLIFYSIEKNFSQIFDFLLSHSYEDLKNDSLSLSRLLRTALRSSNTHYLECLFAIIPLHQFLQYFDSNCFISDECLGVLSNFNDPDPETKSIDLIVEIRSSHDEHRYSYAIGTITLTIDHSWIDVERICGQLFTDHITQIDSPFDCVKSSIGFSATSIEMISLGWIKWNYQTIPNEKDLPMPLIVAKEQKELILYLKNIETNSTDSLAYNYLIANQNLKNFLRYIEQNPLVGVYGAPYLQKKSLFEDLIKYFERPSGFSSVSKFQIVRFNFEDSTNIDDCLNELIRQGFLHNEIDSFKSKKFLLFLPNIQKSCGSELLTILLNSRSTSQEIRLSRENHPNRTDTSVYCPSNFHLFVTMSKRTWSTEKDIFKQFKWIPFKIDNVPWNALLKRHLWRRMIDTNIRENRSIDHELIKTLQWITNIWQRYNECLQKLSLQDALLGPALFFDCPMERDAIFDWFQNKWNSIVAPLVREYSMNKCAQPKSKNSAALAIASSFRANSLEINTPYESVACTTLYVLLHRVVSRDCPLTGQEREKYLLNFVGSRLEGSGTSSIISSAASSRASTPQPMNSSDFISIQLE